MNAHQQGDAPAEFWRLYHTIETEWNRSDDLRDLEPHLLRLLHYIKAHPASERYFKDCFIGLIVRRDGFVFEAVEFCMRELQWPEVYEAAQTLLKRASDWRLKSVLLSICQVYEPVWENADLYAYYSLVDEKNTENN